MNLLELGIELEKETSRAMSRLINLIDAVEGPKPEKGTMASPPLGMGLLGIYTSTGNNVLGIHDKISILESFLLHQQKSNQASLGVPGIQGRYIPGASETIKYC